MKISASTDHPRCEDTARIAPFTRPARQSPAKALARRVEILRAEMWHCLERCEDLEALHGAYLDEALDLSAQIDRLRPAMLSSALREMRELMCRQHPHFEGAIAISRPTFGRAA
jgi:hypothetical protein